MLSRNPGILVSDILANTGKAWDWKTVSANPNLTWQDICNNDTIPWDWRVLSANQFDNDPLMYKKRTTAMKEKKKKDNIKCVDMLLTSFVAYVQWCWYAENSGDDE